MESYKLNFAKFQQVGVGTFPFISLKLIFFLVGDVGSQLKQLKSLAVHSSQRYLNRFYNKRNNLFPQFIQVITDKVV